MTLRALLTVMLRTGAFTFGGGGATTFALRRELSRNRDWLDEEGFTLCYALARITPGTNLFAFCTAVSFRLAGWMGALATLFIVSLPSCAVAAVATAFFARWNQNPAVQAAIVGAMAAAVALVLGAVWEIVQPSLKRATWVRACALVAAGAGLMLYAGWSPLPVLALAALSGWLWPWEKP